MLFWLLYSWASGKLADFVPNRAITLKNLSKVYKLVLKLLPCSLVLKEPIRAEFFFALLKVNKTQLNSSNFAPIMLIG
jgi:hypothetical protein